LVAFQLEAYIASLTVSAVVLEFGQVTFALAQAVAQLFGLARRHYTSQADLLGARRTGQAISIVETRLRLIAHFFTNPVA
jgi:hypothetical protein